MSAKKQEMLDARQKVAQLLETVGIDMNRETRERLAVLLRRAAWVRKRIQSLAVMGQVHLHDEAEATALEWAVNNFINLKAEIGRLREEVGELRKKGGRE